MAQGNADRKGLAASLLLNTERPLRMTGNGNAATKQWKKESRSHARSLSPPERQVCLF